jgi:glycosyltransferase 2 family protein
VPCPIPGGRQTVLRTFPWKQIALSLGVAAAIIWRVPFGGLREAFRNLEAGSLLLAAFSFLVLLFLRAYKWHGLMAVAGNGHVRKSLRALFGGFALGLITPGRLGELGRCVFVRDRERAQVALLTVYDRLLDFWALLTAMGVSLFFVAPLPAAVFGAAVWLAFLPVVMGFPTLVSHLFKLARRSHHLHGRFFDGAVDMPAIPTRRFAVLAVCAMEVELASFYFLLRAFALTGIATAIATYPYIVLAGDLPFSFGGVGVREGAAAFLLSPYAVPSSAAIDASLVWFVFGVLLPALLGALWLIAERVKSRVRKSDQPPDGTALSPGTLALPGASEALGPESAAPG